MPDVPENPNFEQIIQMFSASYVLSPDPGVAPEVLQLAQYSLVPDPGIAPEVLQLTQYELSSFVPINVIADQYALATEVRMGPLPDTGNVRVWLGGEHFDLRTLKVWNGTQFVRKPVKYWNGVSWQNRHQF